MQGWLEKRSEWVKNWNPRHFTLKGCLLSYKESDTSKSNKGSAIIVTTNFPPSSQSDFEFSVTTASNEQWQLRCSNSVDLESWRKAFASALSAGAADTSSSSGAAAAVTSSSSSSTQQQNQQQQNQPQSRQRGQSFVAAAHPIEANVVANMQWFVAQKRSQHLHQWRLRVVAVPQQANQPQSQAGKNEDVAPGVIFYNPIDKQVPSAAEVAAALQKPQRLQLTSADVYRDDPAMCRILVRSGEEFPLRFHTPEAARSFSAAVWQSLASSDNTAEGGMLHFVQSLPSKQQSVSSPSTAAAAGSSTSSSIASSAATAASNLVAGLGSGLTGGGGGNSNNLSGGVSVASSLHFSASGQCVGLLHHLSSPIVIMCGGVDRGSGSNSIGVGGVSPIRGGSSSSSLITQAFHGSSSAGSSGTVAAFAPMSDICFLHLSGEHAHEMIKPSVRISPHLLDSGSTGSKSANRNNNAVICIGATRNGGGCTSPTTALDPNAGPPVREGAASGVVETGSNDTAVFIVHGGCDSHRRVLDDIWMLPIADKSAAVVPHLAHLSWRKVQLVTQRQKPVLLSRVGHAFVPLPHGAGSSAVLLGGFDGNGFLVTDVFGIKLESDLNSRAKISQAACRLARGRARHGVCIVAAGWVIVVGGVAAAAVASSSADSSNNNNSSIVNNAMIERESRVVEIAPLKAVLAEQKGADTTTGGAFSDSDSPEEDQKKNQQKEASSTTANSITYFSSLPVLLPVMLLNPTVAAHPSRAEFFVMGDAGAGGAAAVSLFHFTLNSAGTPDRIPSAIVSKIDLSGSAIPRPPVRMFSVVRSPLHPVQLYCVGGQSEAGVQRILVV